MAEISLARFPFDESHCTLLMISQHWFCKWFDAITLANVDPDLYCHTELIDNDLIYMVKLSFILKT